MNTERCAVSIKITSDALVTYYRAQMPASSIAPRTARATDNSVHPLSLPLYRNTSTGANYNA